MTKKEARALLTMKRKIEAALEECLAKLSEREKNYASAYWAGHILGYLNGGYGSAPIAKAQAVLEAE